MPAAHLFALPTPANLATTVDTLTVLDELVVEARARRRVTQEVAARQIGVAVETLHMIETGAGKLGPSLTIVMRVLAWLADEPTAVRAA